VLLPDWVRDGGNEEGKARLADPSMRAQAAREMKETLKKNGFRDYSYAVVASHKANPSFDGRSIAEIARRVRGGDENGLTR
jgi:N-acyl-D-amino-acid deacylase